MSGETDAVLGPYIKDIEKRNFQGGRREDLL